MNEWLLAKWFYAEDRRQFEAQTHYRVFPSFIEWMLLQLPLPAPPVAAPGEP